MCHCSHFTHKHKEQVLTSLLPLLHQVDFILMLFVTFGNTQGIEPKCSQSFHSRLTPVVHSPTIGTLKVPYPPDSSPVSEEMCSVGSIRWLLWAHTGVLCAQIVSVKVQRGFFILA